MPSKEEKSFLYGSIPEPVERPAYVSQTMLSDLLLAEADVRKRGSCSIQNAFKPPKMQQAPDFPRMPDICVSSVETVPGCNWTIEYACPSSPTPGTKGYALDAPALNAR